MTTSWTRWAGLRLGRTAALLAAIPIVLGACTSNTTLGQTTFGDVLWSMIAFFFWFMLIWMFIAVFADVFRRDDLSGWHKAGWLLFVFVLPLIGILVYLIARPKLTPADRRVMEQAMRVESGGSPQSTADEIAKLAELRSTGAISDEEYERLKQRALA